MNKIFSVIIILFLANFVLAQEIPQAKPLTQPEYVKMLYALEQNPSQKEDVIEAIRTRGLGFKLTDGIRSLTRSKSRNDSELQRTLEESERRRANPTTAKLPSEKEAAEVLAKTRENTLAAVEDMPDFVVKQKIARSYAYAGTGNFRNLDRLVVAVSYRASGFEEYRTLSINGVLQDDPKAKQNYGEVGGTSSTGEFVTVLAKIFKPESDTKFKLIDTDLIRNHKALVFEYSLTKEKAQQLITSYQYIADSTITGMSGKVWIDRKDNRVLRVESAATEIPYNFPIRTANRTIDYDWVKISDQDYLLPSVSDVRLTFRQSDKVFETRNLIRFNDYQKFGTEVILLDDDDVEDSTPANKEDKPAEVDENAPPPLKIKP
jgi:hypothetical protein